MIPDDIQYVAEPVLNHRIILTPETEMEGISAEDVIAEIVQKNRSPALNSSSVPKCFYEKQ